MPLSYRIDADRRLVITRGGGALKDHEVFGYQHEVWSRPDVAGFNELFDMSAVTQILLPSIDRVRDLAELSAEMSRGAPPSRMAIIAPNDLAFGLGRILSVPWIRGFWSQAGGSISHHDRSAFLARGSGRTRSFGLVKSKLQIKAEKRGTFQMTDNHARQVSPQRVGTKAVRQPPDVTMFL